MNILRALMTSVLRMASPKYLSANMVWKCLKPTHWLKPGKSPSWKSWKPMTTPYIGT